MPFTLPADVLKHTLIISSFREPVQRVFSLYFHRVRYDWVSLGMGWGTRGGGRLGLQSAFGAATRLAGGQADGQCAFVCGTGLQPAEPSLLQSGGLTGAPPTLVLVQGGVQKQPFSEFIRTFHTQDEFAKLLAGDACCFHPPAYQSDEASRAQSMPGTLAGAHRPAAPAPAAVCCCRSGLTRLAVNSIHPRRMSSRRRGRTLSGSWGRWCCRNTWAGAWR